jgi:hypothetical protein
MKIYTSHYGNLRALQNTRVIPIGISVGVPKYFTGFRMIELAPRYEMLKMPETVYRKEFAQILAHRNAFQIIEKIQNFTNYQDAALLCWERSGLFCHRQIVAEWISKETGIKVVEFAAVKEEVKV